jgi:hypothetical protein
MPITDHPNYSELNAERQAIFAKLKTAQDARQASKQAYLQCLITPAATPSGIGLSAFDTDRKPSDEKDDWVKLGISEDVSAGTLLQYQVDRYTGPKGSGLILIAQVSFEDKVWSYREHVGEGKRSETLDKWIEHTEVSE